MMMDSITLLVFATLAFFTLQHFLLGIAGISFFQRPVTPALYHRRIAVFVFSDRMTHNLRPVLLQFVHQEYPADKFVIYLVTSDRTKISQFSDLPIRVLLTYNQNKVANCRSAIEQASGVYDIAVSVHQPLRISDNYLQVLNEQFQQGSSFVQPWLSQSESNLEIVPEPAAGFQSLRLSIPLNNAIYSTPFLWLKQQVTVMKDIENYHHGLQYRMLEQGYRFRILPHVYAHLTGEAGTEKKGIINRIEFGLRGLKLLFNGKPSMLFIGIWKFQPLRMVLIPSLIVLSMVNSWFSLLLIAYVASCALIMGKHPQFDLQQSTANFIRQFEHLLPGRKKRNTLAVSTAE